MKESLAVGLRNALEMLISLSLKTEPFVRPCGLKEKVLISNELQSSSAVTYFVRPRNPAIAGVLRSLGGLRLAFGGVTMVDFSSLARTASGTLFLPKY